MSSLAERPCHLTCMSYLGCASLCQECGIRMAGWLAGWLLGAGKRFFLVVLPCHLQCRRLPSSECVCRQTCDASYIFPWQRPRKLPCFQGDALPSFPKAPSFARLPGETCQSGLNGKRTNLTNFADHLFLPHIQGSVDRPQPHDCPQATDKPPLGTAPITCDPIHMQQRNK